MSLLLLIKYNALLSTRLRLTMRVPYLGVAGFLLILCSIAPIAVEPTDQMTPAKLPGFCFFMVYVYLTTSTLLLVARYSNESMVLPIHLTPFPLSSLSLYGHLLLSLIADVKSLLYVIPFGILASALFLRSHAAGLFSVPTIILFFLFIEIWILNAYLLFHRLILLHKRNISILSSVLIIIYVFGISDLTFFERLGRVPVLSWVGAPLSAAMMYDWKTAVRYPLFTLLAASVGLIVGIALSCRRETVL